MEEKKKIRKHILALREEMDLRSWQEKTKDVCEKVTVHSWFQEAKSIYCYVDFRRETGTADLMEKAWKMGKSVAVPKTDGEAMDFYYIHSLQEIAPGNFGVREPDPKRCRMADGKEGLLILPGSAFDVKGHRIGYGKGYYDRYLQLHPELFTMAVAFDFQVLEEIPHESHDRSVQVIVTDRRVIDNRYQNKK